MAAVVTWFLVQLLLDAASPLGARLEAITGFVAIVVLLVVLNWFVHKVYWSEWIGRHHRQRRKLLMRTGAAATLGLSAGSVRGRLVLPRGVREGPSPAEPRRGGAGATGRGAAGAGGQRSRLAKRRLSRTLST
ncbi:MAG TPA: hypothetical protein VH300_12755 [Thermoleophilaceae bacterium]|nr:hypothetical protein [Thermoleophilaceae bacterium]